MAMADHDRGAYAPPTADAPLSFDARQPVRGARPFPVTLVVSGLVLVGLIVAIFLFYRSGVREAGQAPQTVGAPVAEMKSAAPADAQPQDPAAGLQIYQADGGQAAAGQPNFVPPPEQPVARPEPQVAPPPVAAPTSPVTAGPALRPALPPAAAPVAAAPLAPAPAPAPKAVQAPPPAPKPAPAPTPAPVAAKAGSAAVQIGAVSSTALADKAWSKAVAVAPGQAVGKGKGVERIERDGKTLYRTSVTGFASKGEASAFCAKLKAAGTDCFVK